MKNLENHVAGAQANQADAVPQRLPAFTPGPWEVFSDHPHNACVYVRAAPYDDVATCYGGGEAERGEDGVWGADPIRDANALLISAAPDLLRACEDCMENRGDWAAVMGDAIRKARGEK